MVKLASWPRETWPAVPSTLVGKTGFLAQGNLASCPGHPAGGRLASWPKETWPAVPTIQLGEDWLLGPRKPGQLSRPHWWRNTGFLAQGNLASCPGYTGGGRLASQPQETWPAVPAIQLGEDWLHSHGKPGQLSRPHWWRKTGFIATRNLASCLGHAGGGRLASQLQETWSAVPATQVKKDWLHSHRKPGQLSRPHWWRKTGFIATGNLASCPGHTGGGRLAS